MKFLAWSTVAVVFVLMVWGNIVSSTGAGLACPDWPLCHGSITPPAQWDIILEWGHRLLAFVGAIFMIATAITAWKSSRIGRMRKWIRYLLALLAIQVLLGGATVLLGLSRWASSIHLVCATLLWTGFILIAMEASGLLRDSSHFTEKFARKWKRFSYGTLLFLLIQIALGGLVRHSHAGLACPNFPLCGADFFPEPYESAVLAFTHRWLGVLMLGGFLHLWIYGRNIPFLKRLIHLVLGCVTIQIVLGVLTVWTKLDVFTRAIHAANGYLLWGATVLLAAIGGAFSAKRK